ncbi:MAG: efflux transporter outer membrane subunit [Magnetococcales bacterium]|nr:efflux transporter outer membrane subunit [Magnetococcales bacterium]
MKKALFLLPLLWGCTLYPDWQRPEAPVATQWLPLPTETTSPTAHIMAWESFFHSPPLRKVIRAALANNRDLRQAALTIEAAQALYRVESADLLPSVSAGMTASRTGLTRAQNSDGNRSINASYSANVATTAFELDLFGRLRQQNKAALQRYFATRAARDTAQISLIASVANTYLQWLADRKILTLAEETLTTQTQTYALVRQSHEKGVGSKLDVAQVQIAVETARANQALYQRRVMQGGHALQLLMGSPEPLPTTPPTLEAVALTTVLPPGLPAEILLQRPDVVQAEHALQAAHADIGAARAAFFPQISLTAGVGLASAELGNLFSNAAGGAWNFIPKISLPIFDHGLNQANLDYAKIRENSLIAAYEQTIQTAFREVADALAARQTLELELMAQRDLVAASQKAYDLSFARYKGGIDSFLDVLDAQRSLFAAQQHYIEVEKQRLANQVNLYKALGGGLQ